MSTNLTLSNDKILSFFEGRSDLAPVAEFMYVHSYRPMPNFMNEIEALINKADLYLQRNPSKTATVSKLLNLSEQFGATLGEMDERRALDLLFILRQIYQLCNTLPLKMVVDEANDEN